MNLESMFQEIILEHYRNPHHAGLRDPFDTQVYHANAEDEVTMRVALSHAGGEPVVADVSYSALGCAISQASTSIMADLVIGKTVSEAMEISEAFLNMMRSRGDTEPDEDILEEAVALAGVAKYPVRVRCALLGWMAWKDATAQALTRDAEQRILERYPRPQRAGLREPFDSQVDHVNQDDQDQVTVRVTLSDTGSEPVLVDVSYSALGCAISQASTSVMAGLVIGKTVSEAMEISEAFLDLVHSRGDTEPGKDMLGDAIVFGSVAKCPATVTCALLGWIAWKDATARALGQTD